MYKIYRAFWSGYPEDLVLKHTVKIVNTEEEARDFVNSENKETAVYDRGHIGQYDHLEYEEI